MNRDFVVSSSSKNYAVCFVEDNAALIDQLTAIKNPIIIIDQQLEHLYPDFIAKLKSFSPLYGIEASEENKTLAGAEVVLKILQSHNATKSSTVVAMGGGIVQDIVSFAAHIYYRGLNTFFVPTTLLAMCDSCIGGKCGLNYHGYKNQLGAYHPPEKVMIWAGFLESLSKEAIYSGYGEIFKLMLISSSGLYESLKQTLNQEGFYNTQVLDYIHQGLLIKKKFVEEDEFDTGIRHILNYGHTFGHALELATYYKIPHGIAVARGIDIANYIAWKNGLLGQQTYMDIHVFIEKYFHCDIKPAITADVLIANAQKDKKMVHDKLNMIFMENIGKLKIAPIVLDQQISKLLSDYLEENPALYN